MGHKTRITIETMRLHHLDAVRAIERQCFTTPWSYHAFHSELTANDAAHYEVAKIDQTIVGYVGMWVVIDEGHITNLAVDPSYQRQGIGRRLMESVTAWAKRRGVIRMTLEVRASNHKAQLLYETMGYISVGFRLGYYIDNKEDAIIMWKELSDHDKDRPSTGN